jgi:phage-related minor tail protein
VLRANLSQPGAGEVTDVLQKHRKARLSPEEVNAYTSASEEVRKLTEQDAFLKKRHEATKQLNTSLKATADLTASGAAAVDYFGKSFKSLTDDEKNWIGNLLNGNEALARREEEMRHTAQIQQNYNLTQAKANNALYDAKIALEVVKQGSDVAAFALERFGVSWQRLGKAAREAIKELFKVEQAKRAYEGFADSLTSVFNNAFLNLRQGFGSFFKSIIQGFEQMLQEMAAKYLASQAAKLFLNLLGSAFGGKDAFAEILGSISGKAAGGPVYGGTPYLVGEHGPELFTPGRSGHITSNAQLAGAGGGAVTITMNIHATDAQSFRKSQHQIMADLDPRLVREASRRSGR